MVYWLLEGSWEVHKKYKAGQMYISKGTGIDNNEIIFPTHIFFDLSEVKSEKNRKTRGEKIATEMTCPFFLL